jgi:hypothetical protein
VVLTQRDALGLIDRLATNGALAFSTACMLFSWLGIADKIAELIGFPAVICELPRFR